jgi:hypothetical protein
MKPFVFAVIGLIAMTGLAGAGGPVVGRPASLQ